MDPRSLLLALAALAVAAKPPHPCAFATVTEAKTDAYHEYLAKVRAGRIDGSQGESFCYIYTIREHPGHAIRYFHSEWEKATFLSTAGGQETYEVRSPIAETEDIRRNTFIHTHPTGRSGGEGPSRTDVLTAGRYRRSDGRFRYLYLINNHLRLIQFKAVRNFNPDDRTALWLLPPVPRKGRDWLD